MQLDEHRRSLVRLLRTLQDRLDDRVSGQAFGLQQERLHKLQLAKLQTAIDPIIFK